MLRTLFHLTRRLDRRAPARVVADLYATLRHRHHVSVLALGHQKSGTTAIAGLLAAAMNQPLANDPLYQLDLGRGQFAADLLANPALLQGMVMANRRRFCRPVLKDPDLTFVYPEARKVFPRARALFVVRDPRTMIRSIADRLRLSAADLGSSWEAVRFPNNHWRRICSGTFPDAPGATVTEVLARRWSLAAQVYLDHRTDVTLVRYESFVKDKVSSIAQLASALGVRTTADVSGIQDVQFQPQGNVRAPLPERLGARNLERIELLCADLMREFGYGGHPRPATEPTPQTTQ